MYYVIFTEDGASYLKPQPFASYDKALEYASTVAPSREAKVVEVVAKFKYDEASGAAELDEGSPCGYCNVPYHKPGGWHCPHCGGC